MPDPTDPTAQYRAAAEAQTAPLLSAEDRTQLQSFTGVQDAPLKTAGADQPQLFPTGVDVQPVVAAVVQSVQATTEPHNWAMTAASVLQALQPTQDAWMAVSRASPKTQASVMLGEQTLVALAGILQLFFPHPRAG